MMELGFKNLNSHIYGFIFWQSIYSPLNICIFLTWNLWLLKKFSNLTKLNSVCLPIKHVVKAGTVGSSYIYLLRSPPTFISIILWKRQQILTRMPNPRIIIKQFTGDKDRKGKAVNVSWIFESDRPVIRNLVWRRSEFYG